MSEALKLDTSVLHPMKENFVVKIGRVLRQRFFPQAWNNSKLATVIFELKLFIVLDDFCQGQATFLHLAILLQNFWYNLFLQPSQYMLKASPSWVMIRSTFKSFVVYSVHICFTCTTGFPKVNSLLWRERGRGFWLKDGN